MFKMPRFSMVVVLSGFMALHCPASHAEWVEWLADGSVSGKFANNINSSFFSAQQLDDFLGKAALSVGRAYQLGDYTRAYLTAEWGGDTYQRFEKLNQYTVGGKAVLTHKFGLGRQAPTLRWELADAEIFSASQLRSGNQLTTGLRLSSWCNDVMQGFIGYRFDNRNAPPRNLRIMDTAGSAFAIQGHTFEIGGNFVITRRMQLNTAYSHRWGDIVSNNKSSSVTGLLNRVDSIADDDAFPGWLYRAKGDANLYNLGLSYALLDGHAATALNYSYIDTDALGLNYASHQVQLSVLFSY